MIKANGYTVGIKYIGGEPTPIEKKTEVVTKSTGGYDAAITLKYYENDVLVESQDFLYTNVGSEALAGRLGCVKLWYSNGWFLVATETCEKDGTTYYTGQSISTWAYNSSVDYEIIQS